MKKTFILIISALIAILIIIYVNYSFNIQEKNKINEINSELIPKGKENDTLQINEVVTLMNKAISLNRKNNLAQDEKNYFLENDTNSIKIYLERKRTNSDENNIELVQIPMEDLMLSKQAGPEVIENLFRDLSFKITEKEYHQKTGQIKKIVISEINSNSF